MLASLAQGGPEFEHMVCGTDERPFAAHLPHPAQQELSIAAALLDLAEGRLDDRFAPGVEASPTCGTEGAAHPISH
jgi:hypothetical protein